jgi:hypothetical protein
VEGACHRAVVGIDKRDSRPIAVENHGVEQLGPMQNVHPVHHQEFMQCRADTRSGHLKLAFENEDDLEEDRWQQRAPRFAKRKLVKEAFNLLERFLLILEEVTEQDIGVDDSRIDHRESIGSPAQLAAAASSISSIDGAGLRARTSANIPRRRRNGAFAGSTITSPSFSRKTIRSPGLTSNRLRTAAGRVTCPLTVIFDADVVSNASDDFATQEPPGNTLSNRTRKSGKCNDPLTTHDHLCAVSGVR